MKNNDHPDAIYDPGKCRVIGISDAILLQVEEQHDRCDEVDLNEAHSLRQRIHQQTFVDNQGPICGAGRCQYFKARDPWAPD